MAGVVGIVGPVIAAWAASRRLRKQQNHERRLRDRDHTRERLDDAIRAGQKALERATNTMVLLALEDDDVEKSFDQLTADYIQLTSEVQRVALWRKADDAIMTALLGYQDAMTDIIDELGEAQDAPGSVDSQTWKDLVSALGKKQRALMDIAIERLGVRD